MRMLSWDELEAVSGGYAGYDSCDYNSAYGVNLPIEDHGAYVQALAQSAAMALWAQSHMKIAIGSDTNGDGKYDRVQEFDVEYDGEAIVVKGWTMPPGYQFAPGDMGDKYLVRPDGKLVFTPEYAQQVCNNYFGLMKSESEVNTVLGSLIAMLGSIRQDMWIPPVTGAVALRTQLISQNGGDAPPWCTTDGGSSYDPTRDYPTFAQ